MHTFIFTWILRWYSLILFPNVLEVSGLVFQTCVHFHCLVHCNYCIVFIFLFMLILFFHVHFHVHYHACIHFRIDFRFAQPGALPSCWELSGATYNENQRKSAKIKEDQRKSTKINENQGKSTNISENQWQSTNINEHQRKSGEISENQWQSVSNTWIWKGRSRINPRTMNKIERAIYIYIYI